MEWEADRPNPAPMPRVTMKLGDVSVSVSPAHGNSSERWCYVAVATGEHTAASMDECQESWPRKALAMARAQLDAFEEALNEEEAAAVERGWHGSRPAPAAHLAPIVDDDV